MINVLFTGLHQYSRKDNTKEILTILLSITCIFYLSCGVWQKVKVNFVQTDFVSSLMHPTIFFFVLSFPLLLSSIPRPMGPCFYSYKCVISTVPAESCLRSHVDKVKANDLRWNDGVRIDKSIGHHTLLLSSSSSPPHTVAVVQLFLASNSHSLFKSPT